jgi:hypothetical protein
MIAYGNWMVRHAAVYRTFLKEVHGYTAAQLASFDFTGLQREVRSLGGTKSEEFKPFLARLNGAW